jgi:hypothetical protein
MTRQLPSLVRMVFAFIIFAMGYSPAVQACSCAGGGNLTMLELVKGALQRADTVFIGTPIALHGESATDEDSDVVVFDVETVFKGEQTPRIAVHSGIGTRSISSCGYSFKIGTKYLVFLDRVGQSSDLIVQVCGGYGVYGFTGAVDESGLAFRYLRNKSLLPDDFLTPSEIHHRVTGTIYGTIRRADGKPLGDHVTVYVWDDSKPPNHSNPLEWNPRPTVLVKNGLFNYGSLPPGTYWVSAVDESFGTSRWAGFFPSLTDPSNIGKINLAAGQDLSGVDIVLHEQREFSIRGVVRTEDGRPFPIDHTEIRASMDPADKLPFLQFIHLDSENRFFIPGIPGGKVRLETYIGEWAEPGWEKTVTDLDITADTDNVDIILKRKPVSESPPSEADR